MIIKESEISIEHMDTFIDLHNTNYKQLVTSTKINIC
jgi:hypothetical protein